MDGLWTVHGLSAVSRLLSPHGWFGFTMFGGGRAAFFEHSPNREGSRTIHGVAVVIGGVDGSTVVPVALPCVAGAAGPGSHEGWATHTPASQLKE